MENLTAACGMNCALCRAYQGKGLKCGGCRSSDTMRKSCVSCSIKKCENKTYYCYECDKYPCLRLKRLDKRYREKYGMSMIENLDFIKKYGIKKFTQIQTKKYKCPKCGMLITVHGNYCLHCGK